MRSLLARTRGIPLLLVLIPALAGCGSSSSVGGANYSGPAKAIVNTVSNLASDSNSRNLANICNDDLATQLVTKLGLSRCQKVIGDQLNEVDNYALTVEKVTVTGKTGTAVVKDIQNGNTHRDTLDFVKEGGSWKISGLS